MATKFTKAQLREEAAWHEAGHAVVAWRLGIRTNVIKVGEEAVTTWAPRHSLLTEAECIEHDKRMTIVCCAGAAAQRLPKAPRHFSDTEVLATAKLDIQRTVELATRSSLDPAFQAEALIRAQRQVVEDAGIIEAVAHALEESGFLDSFDFEQVVKEARLARGEKVRPE